MARTYFQKDAAADDGEQAGCSGAGLAGTTFDRAIDEAGPVGSGTGLAGANQAFVENAMHFESASGQPGETSWPSGTVTVRINITTGNLNVSIEEVYVCQVDSTGENKATWGNLDTLGTICSAGVKTFNVGVSALSPLVTDQIYITVGIQRILGHGNQQFTVTMNQEFDTPLPALPTVGRLAEADYARRRQFDRLRRM